MKRFGILKSLIVITPLLIVSNAYSEVRIGKNVRIGGHDVSNQVFTEKRRGVYYIYETNPKNPGCRWRKNKDGSKTKVCHLKRKK
jgi:hypothetical protein